MLAGDEARAAEIYAAAIAAARKRGDLFGVTALSVFRGWLRIRTGDLLAAEEDLQPAGQLPQHDDPSFRVYRAAFLAEVMLECEQAPAARDLLASPFDVDTPVHRTYTLYARGRVAIALADPQAGSG
jgi:hypothetical protein